MPEKMFRHARGLITKSEVRAVSLSKLKLMRNDHVLWDIGAGSGAVSIEASCLLPQGHVFAFEKNSRRIPDIIQNISNFERANIKVLNTSFPEGIGDIRRPDRIFIGGGGSALESIIQAALEHLDPFGSIVINTVLIENLHTAIRILKQFHIDPEIVQMQISRSKTDAVQRTDGSPQPGMDYFREQKQKIPAGFRREN